MSSFQNQQSTTNTWLAQERFEGLRILGQARRASVPTHMPTQVQPLFLGKMTHMWSRTAFYSTYSVT